ncbi:hypothetical protein KJ891_05450, partial [Candidatus Micrarchaeota archaeon]|nr:hypothetical protein [Candidatus Micrarchaeota archaeon]
GIWECPQGDQVTDQTETGTATEADETIITTDGTATTDGQTTTDEEEKETETTETTSEGDGTEQTAADAGTEMPATGLVTTSGEGGGYGGYVCGNGMCEPSMGESYGNCSSDCMQGTDGQQGRGTIVVTSEGGKTNMVSGGQQAQGGQGQYGQQMYAQGPSPEMLCEMSDEDIINQYVTMPMGGGNDEKMLEYKCGQESGRIIDEMNMYALNTARCRAETALDCEAKRQAVKSCNEA